jgi:hypothetical protein
VSPGGDDFEVHRLARTELVAVFVNADIRVSTEAIAMLAIHESSAGRADRQGACFGERGRPVVNASTGEMPDVTASELAEVIIGDLGAVALTDLIAPVGRFVSPPAENVVATATSPISSADKSMNRHSRASDRTQAICLALAGWRANISRIIRSPEKDDRILTSSRKNPLTIGRFDASAAAHVAESEIG